MKRSDWITICSMMTGVLLALIGSVWHLSYKIGGIDQRISSMDKTIDEMKRDMSEIRVEIAVMKVQIAEINVKIAAMEVKVDELWKHHSNQAQSRKTSLKTQVIAF